MNVHETTFNSTKVHKPPQDTMNLNIHPIAGIFPPMSETEFHALKADIAAHGQLEPVWFYEDQLIDGRNRVRACDELGIEPLTRTYHGDDPVAFVVSLNLHRRHLSESQRGMVAANLANMVQGQRNDLEPSANLQKVSQARAAEMLNVSERTVAAAAKVKDEGAPELVAAVESGHMAVSLAAQVVDLPDADKDTIASLKDEPQRMVEVAREVVHNHRAQGTGENEWYTPIEYVEAARRVMGKIDLDPASSDHAQAAINAAVYFTRADDGLAREWSGRVWLNPPYAQPAIQQFIEKLVASTARLRGEKSGKVSEAILLTHNYTDTAWFQLAAGASTAICFTRGRIGFLSPEGKRAAPTQGQAFFYFGERVPTFVEQFKRFGFCVEVLARCERDAGTKSP